MALLVYLVIAVFFLTFLSSVWDDVRGMRRVGTRSARPSIGDNRVFEAVFSMLAKLSKADGRISEEEIAFVEHFMSHVLRLNPEARQRAMLIFRSAKNDQASFRDLATDVFASFHREPFMLRQVVDLLLAIAHSDNHFSKHERELVSVALDVFGMKERLGGFVWGAGGDPTEGAVHSPPSGPYYVLGLPPTATFDQVRKRYRELVLRYHPDRLMGKDSKSEFREFAAAKFREIQAAYEEIKAARSSEVLH